MNWEKYFQKKSKDSLVADCTAYAKNNEELGEKMSKLRNEISNLNKRLMEVSCERNRMAVTSRELHKIIERFLQ